MKIKRGGQLGMRKLDFCECLSDFSGKAGRMGVGRITLLVREKSVVSARSESSKQ